jgi:hypothetical protein
MTVVGVAIVGLVLLAPSALWTSGDRPADRDASRAETVAIPSPTLPATGGGVFARGWKVDGDTFEFGTSEHTPLGSDVDGDGDDEPVIFDPTTGSWSALIDGEQRFLGVLGQPGDQPLLARFGSATVAQPAVYRFRLGMWLFETAGPLTLGDPGDLAVPADYDGDGIDDPAVFRPATGEWVIDGAERIVLGERGDVPVPADYDGDGIDEAAVFRPAAGEWWVQGVPVPIRLGDQGDIAVPADYDGDGIADPAVYRQQTGEWIELEGVAETTAALGLPLALDLDGDGAAERVVALTLPS